MDRKITTENISGELAVDILRDLISEGYAGQELLEKFIDIKNKLPMALELMMADVDAMIDELPRYSSLDEIFGKDDEK